MFKPSEEVSNPDEADDSIEIATTK